MGFLVILGYVFPEPEHRGLRDRTPKTKPSVMQRCHVSLSRNYTPCPCLCFCLRQRCSELAAWTEDLSPLCQAVSKGVMMFIPELI